MMSLTPVPSAPVPSAQPDREASCSNCSAPLADDQRYCLSCGHPVSPVRLPFLDVLGAESQPPGAAPAPVAAVPAGYAAVIEPAAGPYTWLRRYSGLFGLLSVLLLAILAGLLVGHWVTQSRSPSRQVLEVKGLSGLATGAPLAASAAPAASSTTGAATTPAAGAAGTAAVSKAAAKAEAHEAQEARAIEKTPPPKAVKVTPAKLKKLGSSTGRKHEEEVNSLGAQPIETG